jgi:ribonuclease III
MMCPRLRVWRRTSCRSREESIKLTALPDPAKFEQAQGILFTDKMLLQRAFVHRSYVNESDETDNLEDNERLEFLGDMVLGYVVSEELYRRYPQYQEGQLTSIRSALVRRETLARHSQILGLGNFLLLGHGEEESGGRERTATLCAVFEAVVGALYLDQGIDSVRNFVLPLMHAELERVELSALEKDAKSRLQEYVQSNLNVTPRYRTAESSGPDHNKTFVMKVLIADQIYGVGAGHSKQEATQQAAAMALDRLGQYAPEYKPNPPLEARFGLQPNDEEKPPPTGSE